MGELTELSGFDVHTLFADMGASQSRGVRRNGSTRSGACRDHTLCYLETLESR